MGPGGHRSGSASCCSVTLTTWWLVFSPDGRWLATGSVDNTAMLWDLEDPGAEPRILDGHTDEVRSLPSSPDGGWLATGSLDSTIQLREMDNPDARPISSSPGGGFILLPGIQS